MALQRKSAKALYEKKKSKYHQFFHRDFDGHPQAPKISILVQWWQWQWQQMAVLSVAMDMALAVDWQEAMATTTA